MRVLNTTRHVSLGALFALATTAAGAATAPSSGDAVVAALQVIQRDADEIAAGKYHGKSLQAPAYEIGAKWYQIEPTLAKNGGVLVEMRMANASITAFVKDWKHNREARKSAKDVSAAVAELLAAQKQSAEPSPAASPASPAKPTAAAPSGSGDPVQSTSPEKPSPAPSAGH